MKSGFIEGLLKSKEGVCATCDNLIKISNTALACTAHDKLILPEYPPYCGTYGEQQKCTDWECRVLVKD